MALSNLQELYPEVDISDLYAGGKEGDESYLKEAFPVEWAVLVAFGRRLRFIPTNSDTCFLLCSNLKGRFTSLGSTLACTTPG